MGVDVSIEIARSCLFASQLQDVINDLQADVDFKER